ncbi:hypothetical protein P692DRAFT_201787454 [Suillus brevipes Sb2]|nr:hypothetical protein P692DRAFT_201787454 [Suillus brevipes Sb2]
MALCHHVSFTRTCSRFLHDLVTSPNFDSVKEEQGKKFRATRLKTLVDPIIDDGVASLS